MSQKAKDKLIRQRATTKSKLTIFSKYLEKITIAHLAEEIALPNVTKIELNCRLGHLKTAFQEYENFQAEIDELTDDEAETTSYRERFETDYFEMLAKSEVLLSQGLPGDQAQPADFQYVQETNFVNPNFNPHRVQGVRLPTIELPKFGGGLAEWLGFRDTFVSLIHQNSQINDIQKFHYLRAALHGDAEQIIKSLEFSAANYTVAWEALLNRFDNKNLLINNHIKAIFNIEPVQRESATQIRKIIDTLNKHLRALNALQQATDHWDVLLIYIVSTKLDKITARAWEKEKTDNEVRSLEDLKGFLKSRSDMLETLEMNNLQIDKKNKPIAFNNQSKKSFLTKKVNCLVCESEHHIQECPKFLSCSQQQRAEKVKELKLCLNCLRPGHFVKNCIGVRCKKCQCKHNTLLHFEKSEQSNTPSVSSLQESKTITSCCINIKDDGVLSTASVFVASANNKFKSARMILDNGSQTGLISEELCDSLNLEKIPIDVTLSVVNNLASSIKYRCNVKIASKQNKFEFKVSCLVVPEITNHSPNSTISRIVSKIPSHLKLADPEFDKAGKIDILIGNNVFWNLICVGQVKLNNEGLILQKTRLGWILAGPITNSSSNPQFNIIRCNLNKTVNVERQIVKFWELEEHLNEKIKTVEEISCDSLFIKTTKRDEKGRFIVTIPLKGDLNKLGESKEKAMRRLLQLEKRLGTKPELKKEYTQFLTEYENLGHMSRELDESRSALSYYMPHHCVVREDSVSTKVRVVFNASEPTTSGVSFNDLQIVGPILQDDLFSILVRFRKHPFVVSSDVEKMYRQVLITPEQRPFQRILWRSDPNQPVQIYNLNTVTYGTAAASYLAIRCLFQLADSCEREFPHVAKIIRKDFYVDDLVTGASSIEEARLLVKQVSQVLATAGFHLRKWVSNDPCVIENVRDSDQSPISINFANDNQVKTLGLKWLTNSDNLSYSVSVSNSTKITKRQILSEISCIFDPLGLLGPSIVLAKITLQKLWLEKLSWDESLPVELHSQWLIYREQLPVLNSIKVPRHVICKDPVNVQLHGFSDASKDAYGACIYMRSEDEAGNVLVRLFCSKSRVAPVKYQSIPRLELCGAFELAKLSSKVKSALDLPLDQIYYWCDSTIVLFWLRTQLNNLETFEANRVSRIQELTEVESWKHVRSKDNPADCISRGIAPNLLENSRLWWQGPQFLVSNESEWPSMPSLSPDVPGIKKRCNLVAKEKTWDLSIFKRYESLDRLVRVISYCRRFANNCRTKNNKLFGPLRSVELSQTKISLARLSQRVTFSKEIKMLTEKSLITKGTLASLNPFLDDHEILRVGGRLSNSDFNENKKHPILLSASDDFTKMLFESEHQRLLHAGPQLLLYTIREKFWPLGGRSLARKVVKSCIKCFKVKPRGFAPMMGNLPKLRVTPSPPFYTTGVDYAGPFMIKDRKGRGAKTSKCYVSIFICFATKALHLELVSDLTADAFIATLRRFASRRGRPAHLYSDNGTCFVGANNELDQLGKFLLNKSENLSETIENMGISWHFIPAYSPHFGGIWEAGVKSTKYHLKRVAGNNVLTFEELYTLLVQIEGLLNSRPLTPLSSDPCDLSPLTPAHFLIGRSLNSVADPDLTHLPENRLSRWQLIQLLQQHFWKRWSQEYVSELQQRVKWKSPYPEIKKNTLVLLKDKDLPPLRWKLGRIIELYPGKDGISRAATIETSSGPSRRALTAVCPLPID